MLNIRARRQRIEEEPASPLDLTESDFQLLRGLAADQLRFGQAEEALILLRLCQHFRPRDPDTILLLARVLAAVEEWDAANAMLEAHRRLDKSPLRRAAEHLLDAVVARARGKARDAAQAFEAFVARRAAEGAS